MGLVLGFLLGVYATVGIFIAAWNAGEGGWDVDEELSAAKRWLARFDRFAITPFLWPLVLFWRLLWVVSRRMWEPQR